MTKDNLFDSCEVERKRCSDSRIESEEDEAEEEDVSLLVEHED